MPRWLLPVLVARGQRRPAEQPLSRIHVYSMYGLFIVLTYMIHMSIFFVANVIRIHIPYIVWSLEDILR